MIDNEQLVQTSLDFPEELLTDKKDRYVKSPLNYTGGKYRLLPKLMPWFPPRIRTFYDVFCGGANVGVNAKADQIVCLDKSRALIDLLHDIQYTPFDILHQQILAKIEYYGLSQSIVHGYAHYGCESAGGLGSYNKDKYLQLRHDYNQENPSEEKNLLLLLLIIYGFNNQIRFNNKGEFNLPVGKRDYNGNTRRNLSQFYDMTNQKAIRFTHGDFRTILDHDLNEQDFVYLDPPYLLGTASYNENGGWSEADEVALYEVLDVLDDRGIRFALSNVSEHKGSVNTILLDWVERRHYHIRYLDYNYNNSNYQSRARQSKTREVLVLNYELLSPASDFI